MIEMNRSRSTLSTNLAELEYLCMIGWSAQTLIDILVIGICTVICGDNYYSGPLMDRIDIHLEVQRVPFEKPSSLDGGELSAVIRAQVEAARAVQVERFAPLGKPYMLVNGDVGCYGTENFP